jgi:lauroyl/myristoyl acyltransferase
MLSAPLRLLRNAYYLLLAGLVGISGCNRRAAGGLARLLGSCRYRLGYVGGTRSRRLYLETIGRALPRLTERERRQVLRAFWVNHQASLLELFLSPRLTPESARPLADFEGLDRLRRALAGGRGAVVTTLHLGDERLLHILLALQGIPLRALSADFADYGWAARRARLRAAGAFHPLEIGGSPRWMHRSLRRGEAVFVALSGFGGPRGAWVEILDQEVLFSTAPARLALHEGVAVFPAVCLRRQDGRFLVHVGPPRQPEAGGQRGEGAVWELTRDLVRSFDPWVGEHPGQFNWMWYIIRRQETDVRIGGLRPPFPAS